MIVAVITTIPALNNVTRFPLIVALVTSDDVYVHVPVLFAGLTGSTSINGASLNDLFDNIRGPTLGGGLSTTNVVVIVVPDV